MSTTDLPYLKRTTTVTDKGDDVVLVHLDDEITLDGKARRAVQEDRPAPQRQRRRWPRSLGRPARPRRGCMRLP